MNSPDSLAEHYLRIRRQTVSLCEPLEIEDYQIQPIEDASPPKWHLAHVTWFFETFLLKPYLPRYRVFHPSFEVLFNSYYNGVGEQFPRTRRGTLSRPTVSEITSYRDHVDEAMIRLADQLDDEARFRVILGLHHEQQHQELLVTDLKVNFGANPLAPVYACWQREPEEDTSEMTFTEFDGGVHEIGAASRNGFVYDNESPRHQVLLVDYRLADRQVTNAEYLSFVEDDGYRRPDLWLSDAWAMMKNETDRWQAPMYWRRTESGWQEYTLHGLTPLRPDAPVCHVSAYEADAYARWCQMRLPTEMEWEVAAAQRPITGNLLEQQRFHPVPNTGTGLRAMYGNVWEWTQSSYAPYPGFTAFEGQLGEYNGKFMANQLVLRGGSCATPVSHIRPTYRNFFYPPDRWQFTGIRLAQDC